MPFNKSSKDLANLYSRMHKKSASQLNESTNSQTVKETLKSQYYSNTPFHKYLSEYDSMYDGYRVQTTLKAMGRADVANLTSLIEKNDELCVEIFGKVGQALKQGVQSGVQFAQQKLLQPFIASLISKLPKEVQQKLADAAAKGPEAVQELVNKEGDPNVQKQIAGGQPVQESALHGELYLLQYIYENFSIVNEDAAQNKHKQFLKSLNNYISQVGDPALKQQASQFAQYVQQNFSSRGKPSKQAQAPAQGKAEAAPAQPAANTGLVKAGNTNVSPAQAAAAPGGAAPGGAPKAAPGEPPTIDVEATPVTPQGGAPAAGDKGGFLQNAMNFIKNNKTVSAAAGLGLLGAALVAFGPAAVVPAAALALKSGGIGAAVGAAKAGISAKMGGASTKEALKAAGKGAAGGFLAGAGGSVAGQALGGITAPSEAGDVSHPAAQMPDQEDYSNHPADVEAQYRQQGMLQSPEVTQPAGDSDEYTSAQPEAQPAAEQIPGPTPQEVAAQAKSGARGGAADLVARGNEAQNQMALSKGLKPGYHWERDTLGRMMQVKNK